MVLDLSCSEKKKHILLYHQPAYFVLLFLLFKGLYCRWKMTLHQCWTAPFVSMPGNTYDKLWGRNGLIPFTQHQAVCKVITFTSPQQRACYQELHVVYQSILGLSHSPSKGQTLVHLSMHFQRKLVCFFGGYKPNSKVQDLFKMLCEYGQFCTCPSAFVKAR